MAHTQIAPRLTSAALALGALACSSGSDGAATPPDGSEVSVTPGAFLPDDGLIVVEFESGDASGDWVEETALVGFTGSSYLRWDGPDLFSSPGQDAFGFDFWIEDEGEYQFRLHNRHEDADSTMANDLWVRMDGGDWVKAYSWQRGQWTWVTNHEFSSSNKPVAEYDLTPGNHRIEFSGRSFDFMVDRFHLYDAGVVNPEDTSHPESAQAPGAGTGSLASGFGSGAFDGSGSGRRQRVSPFHAAALLPSGGAGMGPIEDEVRTLDGALAHIDPRGGTDLILRDLASVARGGADLAMDPPARAALIERVAQWLGDIDAHWVIEAGADDSIEAMARLADLVRAQDPARRPVVLRRAANDGSLPAEAYLSFDAVQLRHAPPKQEPEPQESVSSTGL